MHSRALVCSGSEGAEQSEIKIGEKGQLPKSGRQN